MFKGAYFLRKRSLSKDCVYLCISVSGFKRYWDEVCHSSGSSLEAMVINLLAYRGVRFNSIVDVYEMCARNIREEILRELGVFIPKMFTKGQLDAIINSNIEKILVQAEVNSED